MKLEIPKFRYLAQDTNGDVHVYTSEPRKGLISWLLNDGEFMYITDGKKNTKWKDTLIDLEVDDYDYCDGILRRI